MLEDFTSIFTSGMGLTLTLAFFTAIIVIYSIFVFYFYKFLAKKNLINFDLNKYNNYDNSTTVKFFAAIFYIIEYLILLPILTVFWFAFLAILILLLSKNLDVNTILLISAALVASVRTTSYVSEDLSKDLAKMLPFTLLAIAITTVGFFDVNSLISRISTIPSLLSNIPYYLLFIVGIELIMRTANFIQSEFQSAKLSDKETEDIK